MALALMLAGSALCCAQVVGKLALADGHRYSSEELEGLLRRADLDSDGEVRVCMRALCCSWSCPVLFSVHSPSAGREHARPRQAVARRT